MGEVRVSETLAATLEVLFRDFDDAVKRIDRYIVDGEALFAKQRGSREEQWSSMANEIVQLKEKYQDEKQFPPGDGVTLLADELLETFLKHSDRHLAFFFESVYIYEFALFDGFLRDLFFAILTSLPDLADGVGKAIKAVKGRRRGKGDASEIANDLDWLSFDKQVEVCRRALGIDLLALVPDELATLGDLVEWRRKRDALVHRNGMRAAVPSGPKRISVQRKDWFDLHRATLLIIGSAVDQAQEIYCLPESVKKG